jgi:hypothetical protein
LEAGMIDGSSGFVVSQSSGLVILDRRDR